MLGYHVCENIFNLNFSYVVLYKSIGCCPMKEELLEYKLECKDLTVIK